MPHRGANATIDRDMLHRMLHSRADRRGVVQLHQLRFAEELGVSKFTVSRIVHEFLDAGRLTRLSATRNNVASYVVADPATWAERISGDAPPGE